MARRKKPKAKCVREKAAHASISAANQSLPPPPPLRGDSETTATNISTGQAQNMAAAEDTSWLPPEPLVETRAVECVAEPYRFLGYYSWGSLIWPSSVPGAWGLDAATQAATGAAMSGRYIHW